MDAGRKMTCVVFVLKEGKTLLWNVDMCFVDSVPVNAPLTVLHVEKDTQEELSSYIIECPNLMIEKRMLVVGCELGTV